MKKVLMVDDDNYKISNVKNLLSKVLPNVELVVETALNPGLRRVIKDVFDFVLLDMSIPVFDVSETSNFNSFGGLTFLEELNRKRVLIPTIIITQYEIIGEGSLQMTSEKLDAICKQKFINYRGLVVYSSTNNRWMEELVKLIGDVENDKNSISG